MIGDLELPTGVVRFKKIIVDSVGEEEGAPAADAAVKDLYLAAAKMQLDDIAELLAINAMLMCAAHMAFSEQGKL